MTFVELFNDVMGRVLPDGDSSRLNDRHKNWLKDCLIDIQRFAKCRQNNQSDTFAFTETEYDCYASRVPQPAGIVTEVRIENVDDQCDNVLAREATEGVFRGAQTNASLCSCAPPSDAVATPVANVLTGVYENDQSVTLTCETEGATIWWSTDSDQALGDFTEYTSPLDIDTDGTVLRFYATMQNLPDSALASETYTFICFDPVLEPSSMAFSGSTGVVATCATVGATIRYTITGIPPNESAAVMPTPLTLTADTTVTVKAFKTGYQNSFYDQEIYTAV